MTTKIVFIVIGSVVAVLCMLLIGKLAEGKDTKSAESEGKD